MKYDKANLKAYKNAENAREKIRDRRRFVVAPPPTGQSLKEAPKNAVGTMYPNSVQSIVSEPLNDGINSVKLGGQVLVGNLRGAKIMSLALEERKTCPSSCGHWTTCYGNGMPFTKRWPPGDELEEALERQISDITLKTGLLVRLHMLGDFYSIKYTRFWARMLRDYPDLYIFGFTAHSPTGPIGTTIRQMRKAAKGRFAMRFSGRSGPWGSQTIDFPTDQKFVTINGKKSLICPEQREAMDGTDRGIHCGNCMACVESDVNITFVTH